jgi:TetR/AcrR family transcriptional repressor of nem operon
MARPREFDTQEALARAMAVFWERGYSDTSLPDLLAAMELTRGSLYKAFKDKKSLFLEVLRVYDEQAVNEAVTLLTAGTSDGWDRILLLFESIADRFEAGDRRGCLLCSTVAGPAVFDSDISAYATKLLARMRAAFQTALEASDLAEDAENLAQMLVTQYVGMRVVSRSNVPPTTIRQSVAALARMVDRTNN